MYLFWFFIVLSIAGLTLFIWSRMVNVPPSSTDGEEYEDRRVAVRATKRRKALLLASLGAVALALLCLIFSSLVIVSTKNIGIKTSFGATAGKFSNGLHKKWPWYQVHEMDAAIQTDSYMDENQSTKKCSGQPVRVANQQTGCVSVSIRWRICSTDKIVQSYTLSDGTVHTATCHSDAADELFQDYRSFDHVQESLVTRELQSALNEVFANYNPLDSIQLNTSANGKKNPSLRELGRRVTSIMRQEIGTQIEVLSTFIPIVHYDPATQQKINQLQQQVAATRIAIQAQTTNKEQATANDKLAKSVSSSPNVLVAQCMTILEEIAKSANKQVPAGFSCWPGGSATPVIANASK